MSAGCGAPRAQWEQVAREAQGAGEAPGAVASMLNARDLLDTRRGGAPVPWTPTTIRHAMNAAGRFRGPRWAAGAWGVAAEAFLAHRQPDFAELAVRLADAGEHAGAIADALNGMGYDARGGIWTAAGARALVSSARALARDREAAAEAVALAELSQGGGQGTAAREVERDTALLEALADAEREAAEEHRAGGWK